MVSTFNPQILVDKLAKLNSSQASIETLSHWCIFHMNKAKYVVETWAKQFHCSPREQRLAFLYLANDILQNSRRKGSEFVTEFWKVLPDALNDVIDAGDEAGRNSALRLINIWEERKVFGPRPQNLKEEFAKKKPSKDNNHLGLKMPGGSVADKIVCSYDAIHNNQMDEDDALTKCNNAISYIDKVLHSGEINGVLLANDLKLQHSILKDSIRELTSFDLLRSTLVSHLKEAILEQEHKLEQIRNQLQIARSREESGDREMYVFQAEEESRKSAAAAVAEKLTASTSSAQMLSFVLSSLASEGVIGTVPSDSSGEYSSEKRAKLETDQPYIPTTIVPGDLTPRASSPPLPPPPPQYSHYNVGSIQDLSYGYTVSPPLQRQSSFTMIAATSAAYSQPSSIPPAPLPRQ